MSEPPLGSAGVRGATVTMASQGIRFVLQIGSLAVLARLLSPAEFGLVAMVTAITGVAEIVRDFGLSSAAIQAKELSDGERSNLFWANVGIGTGCAIIAAACAPLIGWIYHEPAVVPIVWALSWLLVVSGANTQFRAELSRSLRFTNLAVTEVVAQVLAIATAITAAALGAGYWAIVAQQAVLVVATFALNAAMSRWKPGRPRRSVSIRRFFRFGGGVLGTQVIGYATNNVDNIGIGAVWGPGPLGIYSRAYQLLIVPLNQITAPMSRVVLPILSRVQDDQRRFQHYVEQSQLVGSYVLATCYAVAAGLAVPLVGVLFGPGWSAVAPVFALLAVGGMFRAFGMVTYWVYLARGLTGLQLRLYLVMRPVMILIILAGLPWGPRGVALGHSVAFAAFWVVSLLLLGRRARIDVGPLFRQALRSVLVVSGPAAVLAYVGSRVVGAGPLWSLLVGVAVAVVWIACAVTAFPRERAQLRTGWGLLRARRRPPSPA